MSCAARRLGGLFRLGRIQLCVARCIACAEGCIAGSAWQCSLGLTLAVYWTAWRKAHVVAIEGRSAFESRMRAVSVAVAFR